MKNIGQMMKQAQQMQEKMAELQASLDAAEITGVSGGGMVEVTLTGKGMAKAGFLGIENWAFLGYWVLGH